MNTKLFENKKLLSIAAVLLLLTMTISAVAVSPVDAQTATTTRSFVYVGVSPHLVGVGQSVIVVTWTADMPPDVGETAGLVSSPNGRSAWNNPMIVTIMRPDGKNDTLTMPRTDPVGATWINYTPDITGTYQLQVYFPGEWKNSSTTTSRVWYTPDYSSVANLTVQESTTPSWVETPLPTDYWTLPLNGANHEWYVLPGNWLAGAGQMYPRGTAGLTTNFVGGVGTETSHIMWTKQYYPGGLMDEMYGVVGYQTTHYQGINWNGIILNGRLHYTPRMTAQGIQGWTQVDLFTGELLSLDYNVTRPDFGQIYNYESPNQHGGFPYLWRTAGVQLPPTVQVTNAQQYANLSVIQKSVAQTMNSSQVTAGTVWEMLDGFTGKTICYIANVTQTEFRPGGPVNNQGRPTGVQTGATGTAVYGKDGSILRYNIVNLGSVANPNYHLQVWNTSAGTMVASQLGTGYWQWRPAGGHFGAGAGAYLGTIAYNYVHDGQDFFTLNETIPLNSMVGAANAIQNQTASIRVIKQDEYVVTAAAGFNNGTHTVPGFVTKISLKPEDAGTVISRQEFTPPSTEGGSEAVSLTGVYPDDGIIAFHKQKTLERFGYSMETGQQIWKSDPEVQFHYYGISSYYFNSTLFSHGYGGVITAYNVKTGDILWQYYPESIGMESAYGGVYPTGIVAVCDGKLYTVTGEHSPTQPLMRGPNLRCIDAATGTEVWKILGFFGGMSPTSSNIIMADGVLVGLNYFDNQLYAFGKGPSATTVTAQDDVSVLGHKIMIKGTVTDQTPFGRRDINDVLQFSLKGTPAISDDSMSKWMEYLYMQQAKPANATGVSVDLTAVDPNGNYVDIGTVTSDMNGNYALPFDPEIPGTYQIIASFAGSKAYGPSSSTAYLTVEDAPAPTAAPTQTPQSIADQYFVPATIGIILAIVIIGLVIILVLRKRP